MELEQFLLMEWNTRERKTLLKMVLLVYLEG